MNAWQIGGLGMEIYQQMQNEMKQMAKDMLDKGTANCVIAWRKGDFPEYPEPSFFTKADDVEQNMVYNKHCSSNLSKYIIKANKEYEKTLIFLKPCDSFSYNQLLKEHLVDKNKTRAIGICCEGDVNELCKTCTKHTHVIEAVLGNNEDMPRETTDKNARFEGVKEIEEMPADARYDFWRAQLSKCMRCNACRQGCPVCNCKKCVFDSGQYDTQQKANSSSFEEQMFHVIRAFHVAGRCTDCGQCARACPQDIRLELFNRKYIKDINELYGEHQAGADVDESGPLLDFKHDDYDPSGI